MNAHALVIGVAGYQFLNPLPEVVLKDARDVADLLSAPEACGYPPRQVQVLLDREATRGGVRGALKDLARRCGEESTAFLYVSSHGGRIESGPHAGAYLLPVDTRYTSEEELAESAISGAELSEAIQALPARKVVVVFDCCHAGGIGQPKDVRAPTLKVGLPEGYYERLAAGRGRAILASSRSTEFSWVMPRADNSLFTHHLLQAMRGGIAGEDGMVRIFDLFEYVQPRVTADQPNQHPVFKADLEENFPVCLNLGGQKRPLPADEEGFRYDAYISYVDREPDSTWVWDTLVPRLTDAGLRVVVSGDVEEPGVARVVSVERGIRQARRTVIVLSPNYLADSMSDFENILAQTMGVQEGSYRVLPVAIQPIDDGDLPVRINMLARLNVSHPRRADREFDRLMQALKGPLPRR